MRGRPETYRITFETVVSEYLSKKRFAHILNSGRFVYIDNRLVVNDEKYVVSGASGRRHITAYARENESECCLYLQERFPAPDLQRLSRRANRHALKITTEQEILRKSVYERIKFQEEITTNFSQLAWAHMKRCRCHYEKAFCDKTRLSKGTFKRIKKGGAEYRPEFETVMAICYGLNLGVLYGAPLLKSAGYDPAGSTIRLHKVHYAVLCTVPANGIDEYEEALVMLGYSIIKNSAK